MLAQGLVLLVAGMAIVMLFLLLLILVMNGLELVVPYINHILPDPQPKVLKKPAVAAAGSSDEAVAVAIAAAVAKERS